MSRVLPDRLAASISRIAPLDEAAMAAEHAHLNRLTKPPGSLGRLEDLVVQLAGITGRTASSVEPRSIVVMAADHGIAARGVSAYPQAVTAQMVANFVTGGAAINALSRLIRADVLVVDIGVASPIPAHAEVSGRPGGQLLSRRVRPGTADMSEGSAMSHADAFAAIEVGLDVAADLVASGCQLVGVGEMGIGNTTAAGAVVAAMTGRSAHDVTGRGTGIDDAKLAAKVALVERALSVNAPDPRDMVAVLAAVGGLEIAGLVGLILGVGAARVPIILDGFITGAAALVAVALAPNLAGRLVAAHCSTEPGHAIVLEALGLVPLLRLDLRLGEASGAALAISLLDAACCVRDEMATFAAAGVADRDD